MHDLSGPHLPGRPYLVTLRRDPATSLVCRRLSKRELAAVGGPVAVAVLGAVASGAGVCLKDSGISEETVRA